MLGTFLAIKMLVLVVLHSHYCTELVSTIVRQDLTFLRTSQHVLLTSWWPRSRTFCVYLHTSFVDFVLFFPVFSNGSPLLQSTHQDALYVQCYLLLNRFHRYTDCSLKTCNKHSKQHRARIAAGALPNASQNCFK